MPYIIGILEKDFPKVMQVLEFDDCAEPLLVNIPRRSVIIHSLIILLN